MNNAENGKSRGSTAWLIEETGGDGECALLALAHLGAVARGQRSLDQPLTCDYANSCDGEERCIQIENPKFQTIYLSQNGQHNPVSMVEKFYSKLQRWQDLRSSSQAEE